MACKDSSAAKIADRCYVVEGQRDRFRFVDETALKIAERHGHSVSGDSASRAVRSSQDGGLLMLTSPFGTHVSLISLHGSEQSTMNNALRELIAEIERSGLQVKPCKDIEGLEIPVIYDGQNL